MKQNKIYIYGKHAVMEAVRNAPRVVSKIYVASYVTDTELLRTIKDSGIPTSPLKSSKKSRDLSGTDAHQGVIGVVSLKNLMQSYEDFIKSIDINPDTALVVLGEIKDPHNVGAIIRSAAAFGVSGILIPRHKQAPVTGTVVKVSAGMAFTIPLVEIGNVNHVIRDLKQRGFRVFGLDGKADTAVNDESFDEPSVFILGSESAGIREKTSQLCDQLVSIPIEPQCESLNVAASSAVVLNAWYSTRRKTSQ